MSLFSNLFSWAQSSGVLAAAQKAAAAEAAQLIQQATAKAVEHAPGMQPAIEQAAQTMLTATLAGIATKAK